MQKIVRENEKTAEDAPEDSVGQVTDPIPVDQPDGDEDTDTALSSIAQLWLRMGFFLAVADFLSIISCFMFAFFIRFRTDLLPLKETGEGNIVLYLTAALLLAGIWVFLLWRSNVYDMGLQGIESPIGQIREILSAGTLALFALMVFSFMERSMLLSRAVYIISALLAIPMMLLVRRLLQSFEQDLAAKNVHVNRILLVGFSEQILDFAGRYSAGHKLIKIQGFVGSGKEDEPEGEVQGYPVLGSLTDIPAIFEKEPFDQIVICSSVFTGNNEFERDGEFFKIINFCEAQNISLYNLSYNFHVAIERHEVGSCQGVPLFRLRDASIRPLYSMIKRTTDIVLAMTILLIGLPVWILISILIKLSDKGPVFFIQERVGLHGIPFRMYKFRSMVADAEKKLDEVIDVDTLDEPVFKLQNDPRVTTIGRFLRNTSLDEIPQLLNVVKGEMSLVGPRPEERAMVERYTPLQRRRLKAKPGITGLQQVCNRGVPSLSARIKWDLIYMKQQSLLLDIYVLFRTVFVVLKRVGRK